MNCEKKSLAENRTALIAESYCDHTDAVISETQPDVTVTSNGKTAYKVHITESFSRNVIVYAEDQYEAEEIAEDLCNAGIVDITSSDDFGERKVEAIGTPDKYDFDTLSKFERSGY